MFERTLEQFALNNNLQLHVEEISHVQVAKFFEPNLKDNFAILKIYNSCKARIQSLEQRERKIYNKLHFLADNLSLELLNPEFTSIIHTDGSHETMTQKGGMGVYLQKENETIYLSGHYPQAADPSQMEIKAILSAIKLLERNEDVKIRTDSQIAIHWLQDPAAYHPDIEKIKDILNEKQILITLEWGKGHSDYKPQKLVDYIAKFGRKHLANQS